MKKSILILMVLFTSISCFAKDFHFVYVRIDNSMDKNELKEQISQLKNRFSNSDFVLYYSNSKITMDKNSWNENELFGLISEQMSSYAISIPDENDAISNWLEQYLQLKLTTDNQVVSEKYDKLIFDCIVGDEFVNNKNQNDIFARILMINSLNNYDFSFIFYPCGAQYDNEKIKFDTLYNINKNKQPEIK